MSPLAPSSRYSRIVHAMDNNVSGAAAVRKILSKTMESSGESGPSESARRMVNF